GRFFGSRSHLVDQRRPARRLSPSGRAKRGGLLLKTSVEPSSRRVLGTSPSALSTCRLLPDACTTVESSANPSTSSPGSSTPPTTPTPSRNSCAGYAPPKSVATSSVKWMSGYSASSGGASIRAEEPGLGKLGTGSHRDPDARARHP